MIKTKEIMTVGQLIHTKEYEDQRDKFIAKYPCCDKCGEEMNSIKCWRDELLEDIHERGCKNYFERGNTIRRCEECFAQDKSARFDEMALKIDLERECGEFGSEELSPDDQVRIHKVVTGYKIGRLEQELEGAEKMKKHLDTRYNFNVQL